MNYYTLLEVSPSASAKEIQQAYRRLVKIHHPDRLRQASAVVRRQSEEKLKQLNLAYDVLGDPVKRRQYDATLQWQERTFASQRPETGRKAHHTASQTRSTRSRQRPFNQGAARQKMANARSEYLACKSRLADLDQQMFDWLVRLGKTAAITGLGTSTVAALLVFIVSALLSFTGLTNSLWLTLIAGLYLFIMQSSAILVVMHQLGTPLETTRSPAYILRTGGAVIASWWVIFMFTGFNFGAQASFWNLLLFIMMGHMLGCAWLGYDRLKPLLAERRHLEAQLAAAEDVMNYFKQVLRRGAYV